MKFFAARKLNDQGRVSDGGLNYDQESPQ